MVFGEENIVGETTPSPNKTQQEELNHATPKKKLQ